MFLGLDDFMLKLLLVCATVIIPVEVGFAHDEAERKTAWIEGFVIYVAVAVVSLVSAGSDYSKEGYSNFFWQLSWYLAFINFWK